MPFYSMIKSMAPRKRLRFFRIAAWVCLGLCALLIALQLLLSWRHLKVYQNYIPHQATILSAEEITTLEDGRREYESHILTYEYSFKNKNYLKEEEIKQGYVKTNAQELLPGVKIRIFLNPEQPDEAQININADLFLSYGMVAIAMLLSYFVVYQLSIRRFKLWLAYLIMIPFFGLALWGQWQINLRFFPHEQDDVMIKLVVAGIVSFLYITLPFPFLGKFIRNTEEELMKLKLQEMNYDELKPEAAPAPLPQPEAEVPENSDKIDN